MSEMGDFYRDVKQARKDAGLPARGSRKRRAIAPSKKDLATFAALGLMQKSEWHWQMRLAGDLLDFWPSKCRWQWRGEIKQTNWQHLFKMIQDAA